MYSFKTFNLKIVFFCFKCINNKFSLIISIIINLNVISLRLVPTVLLRDWAEPSMNRRNPAPDRLPAARVARGGKGKLPMNQ